MFDIDVIKFGRSERDEQEWKKLFLEAGFKRTTILCRLWTSNLSLKYIHEELMLIK
jgi:hypothetical protein